MVANIATLTAAKMATFSKVMNISTAKKAVGLTGDSSIVLYFSKVLYILGLARNVRREVCLVLSYKTEKPPTFRWTAFLCEWGEDSANRMVRGIALTAPLIKPFHGIRDAS